VPHSGEAPRGKAGKPVPDALPEFAYRHGMSIGDSIRAGRQRWPMTTPVGCRWVQMVGHGTKFGRKKEQAVAALWPRGRWRPRDRQPQAFVVGRHRDSLVDFGT
jgi:hypothetical protein